MRSIGGLEIKRNVLVDGNNLLHRVFHSQVKHRLQFLKPDESIGLSYWFIRTLNSWLPDVGKFTRISVFFDGQPKRRKEIYPEYKSGRESNISSGSSLDSVSRDLLILNECLRNIGIDVYLSPDDEADDLIASFIKIHSNEINIIISDDKDFFQLLENPRVLCYRPSLPLGDRFFDSERSTKYWSKFGGGSHPEVRPSQVKMFKSLCGDSSDSIQGIPRIRKKFAVELCDALDYDELISRNLSKFSEQERKLLLESREKIERNLRLVSFFDQINVDEYKTSGCLDPNTQILVDRYNMDHSSFNNFIPRSSSKSVSLEIDSIYSEI